MHAVRPGLVGGGADHPALGGVTVAADDDRPPPQFGTAQHLHGRDELVEVEMQHPGRHASVLPSSAASPSSAACARTAPGQAWSSRGPGASARRPNPDRRPEYGLAGGGANSSRGLVRRPSATSASTVLVAAATPSTTGMPR